MSMTREEHLAWAKQRALVYVDRGALLDAVTSMLSDLEKHPEQGGTNHYLALAGMMHAQNRDIAAVRHWIEGFR